MIVVTYDEFGGAWDHVPPPGTPSNPGPHDAFGPGTRIPTLVISKALPASGVDHTQHDTVSILTTIENRFGVAPVTQPGGAQTRDVAETDLSSAWRGSGTSLVCQTIAAQLQTITDPSARAALLAATAGAGCGGTSGATTTVAPTSTSSSSTSTSSTSTSTSSMSSTSTSTSTSTSITVAPGPSPVCSALSQQLAAATDPSVRTALIGIMASYGCPVQT